MIRTGTSAIAVYNLGIKAAQISPKLAAQKYREFTTIMSSNIYEAVCAAKFVAQYTITSPIVGYINQKGKLIPVLAIK